VSLPYLLCAIDLDDTLLGPDHRISPRNARAVHAVMARGVTVIIASGRMHEATLRFADQLGLDTPIISYNGAMVKRPHTDDVWLHARIPAELAEIVVNYSREHDLQLNYYLDDHLYTLAYTPWMKLYHDRTLAPVEVRPDFYDRMRGMEPTIWTSQHHPRRAHRIGRRHVRSRRRDAAGIRVSRCERVLAASAPAADRRWRRVLR